MELAGELFPPGFLVWAWVAYAMVLLGALRMAPWGRLRTNERLHVYLGSGVALMLLWSLRTQVTSGLSFHLLGVTAMTLMFGWSLTVLGTAVVLGATILAGVGDAAGYPLSALTTAVVPATLTQVLLVLARSVLPRHFFIFVFVNAFFTAGLGALTAGCLAVVLLAGAAVHPFADLERDLMPFFPLMFFPEAVLNGWIITLMVALRPGWVWSFRDEEYLDGK